MFQDYALFPHLSVKGNVAYGLQVKGTSKAHVDKIVTRLLGIAGLEGFEDRKIESLSGGERQRVALVRTLAPEPSLVMLDEPLGSLDLALRESLLAEMRAIIVELETTALYVTHDRSEAFAFADRVAIMRSGHIVRLGTPADVWLDPRTEFVARFLGHNNIVDGAVIGRRDDTVLIPTDAISIRTDGQLETTVLSSTFVDGHYLHDVKTEEGVNLRVLSETHLEQGSIASISIDVEEARSLVVDEL